MSVNRSSEGQHNVATWSSCELLVLGELPCKLKMLSTSNASAVLESWIPFNSHGDWATELVASQQFSILWALVSYNPRISSHPTVCTLQYHKPPWVKPLFSASAHTCHHIFWCRDYEILEECCLTSNQNVAADRRHPNTWNLNQTYTPPFWSNKMHKY